VRVVSPYSHCIRVPPQIIYQDSLSYSHCKHPSHVNHAVVAIYYFWGCYSAVPIRNRCDPSAKSNQAAYQFTITACTPSTSIGIIVYSNQRDSSMVELYDSEVCLSFKMPRKQPLRIVPWSTSAEIKSLSTISRLNTSMFYIRRSVYLWLTIRQSSIR
jgi:hypothetical protein